MRPIISTITAAALLKSLAFLARAGAPLWTVAAISKASGRIEAVLFAACIGLQRADHRAMSEMLDIATKMLGDERSTIEHLREVDELRELMVISESAYC